MLFSFFDSQHLEKSMKIELKYLSEGDRGKVKRALKNAFKIFPAIVTLETRPASEKRAVIHVTIINGPTNVADQKDIGDTVDAVLMSFGYKLCSIGHGAVREHHPEIQVPAWNIE